MKFTNYEPEIESNKYHQLYPLMPSSTFRMLICGPSGRGKTNSLMHMLYHLYFDKIYLDSTVKKEVLLLNGRQSMKADLKMGDKKITNLGAPTDGNDGATKGFVDDQIHLQANKLFDKRRDSYALHPNFTFSPRGGYSGINTLDLIILSSQADSFMKDHQHGKVYQVIVDFYYNQFFLNVSQ